MVHTAYQMIGSIVARTRRAIGPPDDDIVRKCHAGMWFGMGKCIIYNDLSLRDYTMLAAAGPIWLAVAVRG